MKAETSVRHWLGVFAGLFVAFAPFTAALTMTARVGATAEYANSDVADIALRYVGRWGGNACADSRKPGDYGGQCRSFVNCVVWMASGGTQNLGGRDYFKPFLRAGGQPVTSLDQLQKGDIVQEGQGSHTFIIVAHVSGATFTVVDSNQRWNERVSTYDREVSLSSYRRAFRMGMTQAAVAAKPVQPMMGGLDGLEVTSEGAIARGWALDSDTTRPVDVRFYDVQDPTKPSVGPSTDERADVVRMEVATVYPGYGSSHGFRAFVPLSAGDHVICAYALNMPGTPGADLKLGCQAVQVK